MATSTSQRIAIWVITIVMAVGSLGAYFVVILQNNNLANEQKKATEQAQVQEQNQPPKQALPGYEAYKFDAATATELKKEDLVEGSGKEAQASSTVKVNYFGNLPDGTIFDSSFREGQLNPIEFPLAKVIKGWTDGVAGMKEGGKRRLVIPAEQAYGAQGNSVIPPNTPLAFIVELVEVK